MIEFDHHKGVLLNNETPQRFHVHTIVCTPNGNDYGMDLLRLHYEMHRTTRSTQAMLMAATSDSTTLSGDTLFRDHALKRRAHQRRIARGLQRAARGEKHQDRHPQPRIAVAS
jgi:hypothetical protein